MYSKKETESFATELKGHKGALSMVAIACFLMIFSFVLLYLYRELDNIQKTKAYTKGLLCLKSYKRSSERYLTRMEFLNDLIRIANVAIKFPPTAVKGRVAKKTIQVSQNLYHVSYLKKISSNRHCEIESALQFAYKPLAETRFRFLLKRSLKSGVSLWQKDWKLTYRIFYRKKVLETFILAPDTKKAKKIKVNITTDRASLSWNFLSGLL